MHIPLAKKFFDHLFSQTDGYRLSSEAKTRLQLKGPELTYGEINWDSFMDIMAEVHYIGHHETFYDLGSGTGKPVIAAALLGTFRRALGIELLPDLYQESKRILFNFNKRVRPHLPDHRRQITVDFINSDIFDFDWSDGNVVFCQTTCYPDDTMARLALTLQRLPKGSLVITLSRSLWSDDFPVIWQHPYKMGWGEATVFIYRKLADPET